MKRIPHSRNKSLKAWNAAEEYLVEFINNQEIDPTTQVITFNDRFGYIGKHLNSGNITAYIDSASQQEAHFVNIGNKHQGKITTLEFCRIDEDLPPHDIALIHIPKSLKLFETYLSKVYKKLSDEGIVVCSFMTKHFSNSMIELLRKYFREVEQTKALKKSRLIIAESKKEDVVEFPMVIDVKYPDRLLKLKQYQGVFSSNKIDLATQYLISNLDLKKEEHNILDIGSGCGIISYMIKLRKPLVEVHLLDDYYGAYLSGQLNLKGKDNYFYWDYSLDQFTNGQFNLIISNPPFHFGHEIDFSIPQQLLENAKRVLSPHGRMIIVSNNHINYKSMLDDFYEHIYILNKNDRFTIWEIRK